MTLKEKIISRLNYEIKKKKLKNWKKKLYRRIVIGKWKGKEKFIDEINYLKNKGDLEIYPYEFQDEYELDESVVLEDKDGFFVSDSGKRIYYINNKSYAARTHRLLSIEQDSISPHRYYTEEFFPTEEDILIDIGSAEGREALKVAEICNKIYLFECDEDWIAKLNCTFEPYKDKVTIYKCFAGSEDNKEKNIKKIDTIFKDVRGKNLFIKMDVEGMEMEVLKGAENVLKNNNVRLLVTTYHKQNDAEDISKWLEVFGFEWEFSDNYMLFYWDKDIKPPYFRKGLIRAKKTCSI